MSGNIYCTLFDSFYLSRGLIMYNSLKSHSKDFHLFIFAFDDISYKALTVLNLNSVTVVGLDEFENDDLRRIKPGRTKAEYCWTCTPSTIAYVLERFKAPECTYIDADLFFYSDPAILISELDKTGRNVLITEHGYSFIARLYEEKRAGRFCVQFMTFKNEFDSLEILERWRTQCIDWCYARHEDGKFGDQKYLDEWPSKYANVHILQNQGGGIAPWNLLNYSFSFKKDKIILRNKKTHSVYEAVFYHFQYVKCLAEGLYDIGWYPISPKVRKNLYNDYVNKIEFTEMELQKININYVRKFSVLQSYIEKSAIKAILKKIIKWNIVKISLNGLYN